MRGMKFRGPLGSALHIDPKCGARIEQITLRPKKIEQNAPVFEKHGSFETAPPVRLLIPEGQTETEPDTERETTSCNSSTFNGHILLPFNDRIPGGRYLYDGYNYELPINEPESGDAIHGFFYTLKTELLSHDRTNRNELRAVFFRETEERTTIGYPFALSVRLVYTLRAHSFRMDISVRNRSSSPAPLAVGWHPYFCLSSRVDDLRLSLPADRYVEVDSALLPTGLVPLVDGSPYDFRNERRIGSTEMDIALRLNHEAVTSSGTAAPSFSTLTLRSEDYRLTMRSGPELLYRQIFIPPDRRSIAVEPISAATNSFNLPDLGLTSLRPGETMETWVELELERV